MFLSNYGSRRLFPFLQVGEKGGREQTRKKEIAQVYEQPMLPTWLAEKEQNYSTALKHHNT